MFGYYLLRISCITILPLMMLLILSLSKKLNLIGKLVLMLLLLTNGLTYIVLFFGICFIVPLYTLYTGLQFLFVKKEDRTSFKDSVEDVLFGF